MGAMQHMLLHSVLDAGDVFVLLADKVRPGDLFGLKLQVVEALRVTNPDLNADRWSLSRAGSSAIPTAYRSPRTPCNRRSRTSVPRLEAPAEL